MKIVQHFLLGVLILITGVSLAEEVQLPADITFMIADLKYSESGGVKICEIQPGSVSVFKGYDFLTGGDGVVAQHSAEYLSHFQIPVSFISRAVCDSKLRKEMIQRGATSFENINGWEASKSKTDDSLLHYPDRGSLFEYREILYTRSEHLKPLTKFREKYPGVLFMDAPIFPYDRDKILVAQLFAKDQRLSALRPKFGVYPKKYGKDVIEQIKADITSDLLVIKPRRASRGLGVIIVHRSDLEDTLRYIFSGKSKLEKDPDPSYSYWARDNHAHFLVEEYCPSDPVTAPLLGNQRYDGTMRVVFFLTSNLGVLDIHFIESHWKLPALSIDSKGSLNEKHKSYAEIPHFQLVEEHVNKDMERQLSEGLLILYRMLLEESAAASLE